MSNTSYGVLCDAAKRWPDKAAIVAGGEVITFGHLQVRTLDLARQFVGAGLRPGERFAIWAPNSAHWQIAALAGQAVGCVLVPINTRYKWLEAEDIIKRSGARALFYAPDFLGAGYDAMLRRMDVPSLEHRVDLSNLAAWPSERPNEAEFSNRLNSVVGDSLADILFTSGTTGAPKGVMCTHRQNIRVFQTWSAGVTLDEHDNYLIVNPYFHSFGYKAGWLAALIQGATVFPMPVFDAGAVMVLIQEQRISFLPGAPTIFRSLLLHPERANYDLVSLRCAVTGAASVPVQLVKDMKDALGFEEVYTAYGLTESTGVVSLCKPGDDFETIATTSGKPMDDIEVQITGAHGQPVAVGEPGEVWVRGYNVMQGYFDDLDATAETITDDGWLKTGDIGVMDERGYLKITDRVKDMYICGGFNCYPAEIENTLLRHPDIQDVAVLGILDDRMGEVGAAFVVTRSELSADDVVAWARENMANFKVPRKVEFVPDLPRNASGKVQKFLLRDGGQQ